MENLQIALASSAFTEGLKPHLEHFSPLEMLALLSKASILELPKGAVTAKCGVKYGGNGTVCTLSKSELLGGFGKAAIGNLPAAQRAKLCKTLLQSLISRPSFLSPEKNPEPKASTEKQTVFSFPLPLSAAELSKIQFESLGREGVVSLKKKILSAMLGDSPDITDKGRPVVGELAVLDGKYSVSLGQEQAISLLKKFLGKLNTEQLVTLDAKLGGVLTSLPGTASA